MYPIASVPFKDENEGLLNKQVSIEKSVFLTLYLICMCCQGSIPNKNMFNDFNNQDVSRICHALLSTFYQDQLLLHFCVRTSSSDTLPIHCRWKMIDKYFMPYKFGWHMQDYLLFRSFNTSNMISLGHVLLLEQLIVELDFNLYFQPLSLPKV